MTRTSKVRWMTGLGLALAVVLSRLPFTAATLFEFDSIGFAIGLTHFDLAQVTPHMPGYILHILMGSAMRLFFRDPNVAYIALNLILSIGSVLFMWRAGSRMRGERLGIIAALLWLTTPLFWFYGEVAAIYIHEAFWTSALLYFGIALLRAPTSRVHLYGLVATLALAAGARQTSLAFMLPGVVFVMWKTRQSRTAIFASSALALGLIAIWGSILLVKAGGLGAYLGQLSDERIFRSQSMLFGNAVSVHVSVIAKLLFYLIVTSVAPLLILITAAICMPRRFFALVSRARRSVVARYLLILSMVPLMFYALVYFMKAGYLLNVATCACLASAIVLDELVMYWVERAKLRHGSKLQFTRPMLSKRAAIVTGVVCLLNTLWYLAPLSGKEADGFHEAFTRDSKGKDLEARYDSADLAPVRVLSRAASYTSAQAVRAQDEVTEEALSAITAAEANHSHAAVLDTWWHRWAYYYNPHAVTYDIRAYPGESELPVGVGHERHRENLFDRIIRLDTMRTILLFIRADHPDFRVLDSQLTLTKLSTRPYLDIYRIEDAQFSFTWRGRTLEKR